jgi:hypothetical protein
VLTPAHFLRAHHLDPCFLWAPPAARATVVAWARNVYLIQVATTTQPFGILPEECAGDVLGFLGVVMSLAEVLHILKHCSSPATCSWVRMVVTAATAAATAVSPIASLPS